MAVASGADGPDPDGPHPRTRPRPADACPRVAVVHGPTSDAGLSIAARLALEPFDVVCVRVGRSVIAEIDALDPDVVIVDFDSARAQAVRLCRDIHESLDARIVVVADETVPTDPEMITLLDAGADDFVTQRHSMQVLLARLRVAVRARPTQTRGRSALEVGDVVIDIDAHLVSIDGRPVRLAPLHFALLQALADSPNTTVGLDELMVRVWGADATTLHPRRLRTAVSLLRKALGHGPRRPTIDTVPHFGYRLMVDSADRSMVATPPSVA